MAKVEQYQSEAFWVDFMGSVKVTINNPIVIDRCVQNHDDEGTPQPDEKGGTGWRNTFYRLDTTDKVLAHLAYNCVVNDVARANQLDGWGDLPDDAATMVCEGEQRFVEELRTVRADPEEA